MGTGEPAKVIDFGLEDIIKKDMPFEPILAAVDRLCQSKPDFMSVTYGAGGGTGHNTIKIAD